MCYKYPGPRCSHHAQLALDKANAAVDAALNAGDQDVYITARFAADDAQAAYDRTPKGITALREEGEIEKANQYEIERSAAIAELNRVSDDEGDRFDDDGYDHEGYDAEGYDRDGLNRAGSDHHEPEVAQVNLTMTPAEEKISRQLSNPKSTRARRLNIDYPDASPALLHSLRNHGNRSVQSLVIDHPNTSKATLMDMMDNCMDGYHAGSIVANGNFSPAEQRAIVERDPHVWGAMGIAASGSDPQALRMAAKVYAKRITYNPNAPADVLDEVMHTSPINVAQHPNTSRETLLRIASDENAVLGARKHAMARLRGTTYEGAEAFDY